MRYEFNVFEIALRHFNNICYIFFSGIKSNKQMLLFVKIEIMFQDGQTALHIAVQGCQPRVVETLLGYGAQIRLKAGKVRKRHHCSGFLKLILPFE